MNLLDTVLRVSKAEKYVDCFNLHEVDAFTLKLLGDEDLKIIGVDNETSRELILKNAANFQIPTEKQVNVCVDHQYIKLALNQISMQLVRHLAILSIAIKRDDVLLCDVRLNPAARCLHSCILALKENLEDFEFQILKAKRKRNRRKYVVLTFLGLTAAGLYTYMVHPDKKLPFFMN